MNFCMIRSSDSRQNSQKNCNTKQYIFCELLKGKQPFRLNKFRSMHETIEVSQIVVSVKYIIEKQEQIAAMETQLKNLQLLPHNATEQQRKVRGVKIGPQTRMGAVIYIS